MVWAYIYNDFISVKQRFSALRQTKLWSYWLLILSIMVGIAPLFSFEVPKTSKKELLASGFYGPGVVIAWLITSLWIIGNGECFPMLKQTVQWLFTKSSRVKPPILPAPLSSQQREIPPKPASKPVAKFVGVDGAMVSVIFYPAVAAIDALIQFRREIHNKAKNLEPFAAEYVCRLSMFISWLPIWAVINMPDSIHERYPVSPSTTRLLTWYAIHLLCFVAYYAITLRQTDSLQWATLFMTTAANAMDFTEGAYSLGQALRIFNRKYPIPTATTRQPRVSPLGVWFSMPLVVLLFLERHEVEKAGEGSALVFAWPHSTSQITDLDQWTTVATACLLVTWPHIETSLQVLQRLMQTAIMGDRSRPNRTQDTMSSQLTQKTSVSSSEQHDIVRLPMPAERRPQNIVD